MSQTSRILVLTLGALGLAPASILADGPKFSGYVDATYLYDLNNPASGKVNNANGTPIQGTNFYGGRNASFKLDAAHLTITGGDSAGATYQIDLEGGTDAVGTANTIVNHDSTWAFDVKQAFVNIPFGKSAFGLQAGRFITPMGIEVANSGSDPTLTRGLADGVLECSSHTGAFLTFVLNEQISGAIGAVDGPDLWQSTGGSKIPVAHGRVGFNFGDPFSSTVSAYYGHQPGTNQKYTSLDFTGLTKTIPNLDLNYQANFRLANNAGIPDASGNTQDVTQYLFGLQPLYHMGAGQIGFRYEFLSSDDGTTKTTINSFSLAPGYKLTQNTLVRAEYRIDIASEKIFEGELDATTNLAKTSKTEQVVGGEVYYAF